MGGGSARQSVVNERRLIGSLAFISASFLFFFSCWRPNWIGCSSGFSADLIHFNLNEVGGRMRRLQSVRPESVSFFFLSADHLHKRQRLLTKFRPLVSQRGVDVLKIGPPCRFSFGQIFALSRSESLAVVSYLPFPCYELLTLFLCSTCLQLKWGFYLLPAHHFRPTKRLLERCLFFFFGGGGGNEDELPVISIRH